jgi:hypothetical protein
MKELRRLAILVAEHSGKVSPLMNQQDAVSLETRLFNLVVQGKAERDEDAAKALYGKPDITTSFRMLKSRVRRKLLNHLHFLEFPKDKFRPYGIKDYECSALLLEAQCLMATSEFKIADKLLNQALDLAIEHELVGNIVKALEQKQVVHVSLSNRKAYQETEIALQKYYALEAKERTASSLFQVANITMSSSVHGRKEYMSELPGVLAKLHLLWEETKSSNIFNYYHILSIFYLELQGDYYGISDAVEKAESLLKQGEVHPSWFSDKYNSFIRVYALLQTRQYDLGLALAEKHIQSFDPYSINWFSFMENYLLLAIHSKEYALAGELMQKSFKNQFILKINDNAKERWELYRKYMILVKSSLSSSYKLVLPTHNLVELVKLPKDKVGFNLSLLVLYVIESFTKRGDDYLPQAERIQKYITKYLRGEKAERSRLFLRLLLLAIKEELHPVRAREKGQRIYESMSQTTPPGDAFAEVEIVPYEHLWELVLQLLEQRAKAG